MANPLCVIAGRLLLCVSSGECKNDYTHYDCLSSVRSNFSLCIVFVFNQNLMAMYAFAGIIAISLYVLTFLNFFFLEIVIILFRTGDYFDTLFFLRQF
jgi:hypothetical protein